MSTEAPSPSQETTPEPVAANPLDIKDPGVEPLVMPEARDGAGTRDDDPDESQDTQSVIDEEAEMMDYLSHFDFKKEDFQSPAHTIRAIHSKLLASGSQRQEVPVGRQQVPAQQPRQEAAPKSEGRFEFKIPPGLRDESLYDEDVRAFVNSVEAMHKHYEGQHGTLSEKAAKIEQLESVVRELYEQRQAESAERFFDEFEKLVDADADLHDVMGKGPRGKLSKSHFEQRNMLIDTMSQVENLYRSKGINPPSRDTVFRIAKNSLFPDKSKQTARKEIANQLRDRRGQFTSRAAAPLKHDAPLGDDTAVAAVTALMKERNMLPYGQRPQHAGI